MKKEQAKPLQGKSEVARSAAKSSGRLFAVKARSFLIASPSSICATGKVLTAAAGCEGRGGSSIDQTLLIPYVKPRQSTRVCLLPTSVLFLLCSGVCVYQCVHEERARFLTSDLQRGHPGCYSR